MKKFLALRAEWDGTPQDVAAGLAILTALTAAWLWGL